LIIDDEAGIRELCRSLLQREGYQCAHAVDGVKGLEQAQREPYDLILVDIDMPRMSGFEVLERLRRAPFSASLKVFMFSGRATADELANTLWLGADDYMEKPFSPVQILGRVKAALRMKDTQDRADELNKRLSALNNQLENHLHARDRDLLVSRNTLVLGLTELMANRDNETGSHLLRVQGYTHCLAEKAAALALFPEHLSAEYIEVLTCCAPLHDIGKVGIPDHVLLKAGKLTDNERKIMQTHTLIGSDILRKVAASHESHKDFFQVATELTRHHHERFDGQGYPDRLGGDAIPLAARILAIADVYDGLRSCRPYKPSWPHAEVVRWMTEQFGSHFDNRLLPAFHACVSGFEEIFQQTPG
jgi:putative two-component system response regulator